MGVNIERDGPAAVVVLDWPEARNALGPDEAREVTAAITEAVAPTDVCGVVLTGNGAFCAGGNLKGAVDRSDMPEAERRRLVYGSFQGLVRAVIDVAVPTIAAVDGPAIGLGFDLALACDSRFVGPDGWYQQGWGRVGLVPGTGGVLFLQRHAPDVLWQLLEHQARLDGPAAERLGLSEAVFDCTARTRAVERVHNLAPMSRDALEGYVALQRADLRRLLDDHLALAVDRQLSLLATPGFAERVARALRRPG